MTTSAWNHSSGRRPVLSPNPFRGSCLSRVSRVETPPRRRCCDVDKLKLLWVWSASGLHIRRLYETEEGDTEVRQELKAEARRGQRAKEADGEGDVLSKIAEMPEPDRAMAERLHALIKANAPALSPRTWYGMPAYAKDGNVVCFFQSARRFKTRYATFGFSDKANLDEGTVWPVAFALKELTAADEIRIGTLVKKAVS